MTSRQEKIKEILLTVFFLYVLFSVTAYLLRLFFIGRVFYSEEICIIPALVFLVYHSGKTFLRMMENNDRPKEG